MPNRMALALLTLVSVGCFFSSPALATSRIDPAAGVSARPLRQLVGMPDVSQPNGYTCGAASIEAVAINSSKGNIRLAGGDAGSLGLLVGPQAPVEAPLEIAKPCGGGGEVDKFGVKMNGQEQPGRAANLANG